MERILREMDIGENISDSNNIRSRNEDNNESAEDDLMALIDRTL